MAVLVGTVEAFEEIDVTLFPGPGKGFIETQRVDLRKFLGIDPDRNGRDRNTRDRFGVRQFTVVRW